MADNSGSLINIGELSKPATVLIEKISDAIGGIFRPYQVRRIAQAEAEAEKIRAVAQIEVNQLQRRAVYRFFAEEAKRQANIEAITQKALPILDEAAEPDKMEDDWITNFFDKCRLISDEEMQTLWSKVLAGEGNSPGTYSKRTVNILASMDKSDAEMFKKLCSFAWVIGNVVPLIYDVDAPIYGGDQVFNILNHLEICGLISFEPLAGFVRLVPQKSVHVQYYGQRVTIEFANDANNRMNIGTVLLSKAGQELAGVYKISASFGASRSD